MADTIPDLWGEGIGINVLTPAMILNTQAANIQRRTQGIIVAELLSRDLKVANELNFDIKSRDSKHRTRLLVCRSAHDEVYPVWVTSKSLEQRSVPSPNVWGNMARSELPTSLPDWLTLNNDERAMTKIAFGQDAFIEVIGQVLSSDYVAGKINSMIARSNETSQRLEHVIPDEYYQQSGSE